MSDANGGRRPQQRPARHFSNDELVYVRQHRAELEAWVAEGRYQYWILALGLLLGVLAHASGYSVRAVAPGEPLTFLGDLLYGLGLALWTGVVVTLFVQVLPEIKRRQLRRYLADFDAQQASTSAPPRNHGGRS